MGQPTTAEAPFVPYVGDQAYPAPIIIARQNPETAQMLRCVGMPHTADPLDRRYWGLAEELVTFQDRADLLNLPAIILQEGHTRRPSDSPLDTRAAIRSPGTEQQLLADFARTCSYTTFDAEPDGWGAYEAAEVFSIESVALYFFMRLGPQLHRSGAHAETDMRELVESRFAGYTMMWDAKPQFAEFDFSYENLLQLYRKTYSKEFTVADVEFLLDETVGIEPENEPSADESAVQQVSRLVTETRRQSFAKMYEYIWGQGISVFGVFGEAHVRSRIITERLGALGVQAKPGSLLTNWSLDSATGLWQSSLAD